MNRFWEKVEHYNAKLIPFAIIALRARRQKFRQRRAERPEKQPELPYGKFGKLPNPKYFRNLKKRTAKHKRVKKGKKGH